MGVVGILFRPYDIKFHIPTDPLVITGKTDDAYDCTKIHHKNNPLEITFQSTKSEKKDDTHKIH